MTWNEITKKLNSTEAIISLVLGIIVVVTAGFLIFNFVRGRTTTVSPTNQAVAPGFPVGEKKEEALVALPTTHKVAQGEYLWNIAEKYYKSGYNWVTLAQANKLANPDLLYVGQELSVPKADPIYPPGSVNGNAATVSAITGNSYKVVKGDTLWSISCRAYADCYKWTEIAKANNLANPDLIEVDQELKLPR